MRETSVQNRTRLDAIQQDSYLLLLLLLLPYILFLKRAAVGKRQRVR